MDAVFTCNFLTVCFEYVCFSILLCFLLFGELLQPQGEGRALTEQPGCWRSCSAVCGVGFGCKRILGLLFKFMGAASAGLSYCTSSLQRDPRTRFVHSTVS